MSSLGGKGVLVVCEYFGWKGCDAFVSSLDVKDGSLCEQCGRKGVVLEVSSVVERVWCFQDQCGGQGVVLV